MNLSGLPAPPSLATIVWVHIFRLQIFQRAALELLFKLAASAANLAWPKVGGTAVTPLRRGSEDAALTAAVRAFVDHYRVVVAGHFSALARRILLGAWHRRVIVGMASAWAHLFHRILLATRMSESGHTTNQERFNAKFRLPAK
jgi:hypothetical protein